MSNVIKAFNDSAGIYDDWYGQSMGEQVFTAELRGLQKLLPPEGLGADLGAGTGIFAEQLTTTRRVIVCVDPSPKMLAQAAERGLMAILGVGEAFPFRRSVLDFTFLVAVLEFLREPEKVLQSIKGALKAGGAIVTLTINRDSPWGEMYRELAGKGDPIFRHAHMYGPDEVESMLVCSGYSVEESLGTLTNPPHMDEIGVNLVPADPEAGVVLFKGLKKG